MRSISARRNRPAATASVRSSTMSSAPRRRRRNSVVRSIPRAANSASRSPGVSSARHVHSYPRPEGQVHSVRSQPSSLHVQLRATVKRDRRGNNAVHVDMRHQLAPRTRLLRQVIEVGQQGRRLSVEFIAFVPAVVVAPHAHQHRMTYRRAGSRPQGAAKLGPREGPGAGSGRSHRYRGEARRDIGAPRARDVDLLRGAPRSRPRPPRAREWR